MKKMNDTPAENFPRKGKLSPERKNEGRRNVAAAGALVANINNVRMRSETNAREASADEVIDLEGPAYDVPVAGLKTLSPSARGCTRTASSVGPSALRRNQTADTESTRVTPTEYREGGRDEASERLSTSRDEAPFSAADSLRWRRKTRRRYMSTFFIFEGEYHSD